MGLVLRAIHTGASVAQGGDDFPTHQRRPQHAVCTPPCRPAPGLDRPKSGSEYVPGLRHVSLFRFLCPVSSLSESLDCRIAAAASVGGATTLP